MHQLPTYSIRNPELERPQRLRGQKWSNFTAVCKEGSFMPLFIQVAIGVLKMRGTLSVSCSLEASAMLGRVGYTISLVRAIFRFGVFYQAMRCDCVTQQLAPASKATATVHQVATDIRSHCKARRGAMCMS